ncbi:uncharacterized protein BJ212DRAFT_1261970 [Suillus subaureus]|uniref:Uncharacterized protein n=1 Tax=Suillus subaureus TaxID=48587 RepID=A0A9P7EKN0_9AGAM|nr:uncharacterized protein BJ212DRAFT_1261970 [Suillus subaureus]KAG1823480.1 hypothetical protein BJ212DRAFT_1261970 [Suillus subaureus]
MKTCGRTLLVASASQVRTFIVTFLFLILASPFYSFLSCLLCAVQWSAWLTHTRPDPPSIEELQADLARQQRVKLNVAILEAKDEAERANRERLDTPGHHPEIETRSPSVSWSVPRDQKLEPPESDQRPKAQTRDPWAEALKGSDEPRSWTPMARKR